jgi:CubicO group peptidase (beta-lactamase class C family)
MQYTQLKSTGFVRLLICMLGSVLVLCSGLHAQQQNEQVFNKLTSFVNQKAADSIYNMLSEDFKNQVSHAAFSGFMSNTIFILGTIESSELLSYKDSISSYKVNFKTAQSEVVISADKERRIRMLAFKPYKQSSAVRTKNYSVATTNKGITAFDRSVDSTTQKYMSMEHTAGLSIGVYKDGQTFNYNYGETAKGNRTLPDSTTIFEIGSITKTFTATLLAYYVEKSKISLNDPIVKYLPDSVAGNKNLQDITVQMLSNHTSGLSGLPDNIFTGSAEDLLNPYKTYTDAKLFSYLRRCNLNSKPGEQYAYSNMAVGLLGVILERVSGLSYEQMVTKVICDPLRMKHTAQHIPKELSKKVASVYNEVGQQVPLWDFEALAAAGCVRSTIHDLLLYARHHMQNCNNELCKAMQLTHNVTNEKEIRVGLGWHYTRNKESNTLWHNGGTGGSSSFLAFNQDKQTAVVILSNSAESVDDIGYKLLELISK